MNKGKRSNLSDFFRQSVNRVMFDNRRLANGMHLNENIVIFLAEVSLIHEFLICILFRKGDCFSLMKYMYRNFTPSDLWVINVLSELYLTVYLSHCFQAEKWIHDCKTFPGEQVDCIMLKDRYKKEIYSHCWWEPMIQITTDSSDGVPFGVFSATYIVFPQG